MFLAIIFPLFNGLDDLAEELYGIGMEACPLHQKCVRSFYQEESACCCCDDLVTSVGNGPALWLTLSSGMSCFIRQSARKEQVADQMRSFFSYRDSLVMYPMNDAGDEAGFLAEQFPVVRWMFGPAPPALLHCAQPFFVMPEDAPPTAEDELAALRQIPRDAQRAANL